MTVREPGDNRRSGSATSWRVRHRSGSAAALHGIELPDPPQREVWVLAPDRPALVLGSTQADDVVAAGELERRGIDLARRRSGGGAVLLDPRGAVVTVWIDLVVPRSDPLWTDDVSRSMDWLGDAWVDALGTFGLAGEVHRGALERTAASTLVCFAGVGPGEVVVDARKVVGISQRRNRAGARFQCVAHVAVDPEGPPSSGASIDRIVDLLRVPGDLDRPMLVRRLQDRTGVIPARPHALVASVLAALPDGG